MEGIFSGLLEQIVFDGIERGLTETLQGQNHPIGQQAVHQNSAHAQIVIIVTLMTNFNIYFPPVKPAEVFVYKLICTKNLIVIPWRHQVDAP